MSEVTRAAIRLLQEASGQSTLQKSMADLKLSNWSGSAETTTALFGRYSQTMAASVLGMPDQSIAATIAQLSGTHTISASAQAHQLFADSVRGVPSLSKMFDLHGQISASEYVKSLTGQTSQLAAAVGDMGWGQSLAQQFLREGATDAFLDELIDYTTVELRNPEVAEGAFSLSVDIPDLQVEEPDSAVKNALSILYELSLQHPAYSAASILFFAINLVAIVSSNPEIGRLQGISSAVEMLVAFVFVAQNAIEQEKGKAIEGNEPSV